MVAWEQCPPRAPGRAHRDGAALGTPVLAGPSLSELLFRAQISGPEGSSVNMQWDGTGGPQHLAYYQRELGAGGFSWSPPAGGSVWLVGVGGP